MKKLFKFNYISRQRMLHQNNKCNIKNKQIILFLIINRKNFKEIKINIKYFR